MVQAHEGRAPLGNATMTGLSAWFLIMTICSSEITCADLLVSGHPFYDEESCLSEGRERAATMLRLEGYQRVEVRCELWPLER